MRDVLRWWLVAGKMAAPNMLRVHVCVSAWA